MEVILAYCIIQYFIPSTVIIEHINCHEIHYIYTYVNIFKITIYQLF